MDAQQFVKSRQHDWEQLSKLLDRSQNRIEQLSPAEVKHLGALYRAAASDLALAQRAYPREKVTVYLNGLVARGHSQLYRSRPLAINRLVHYITTGFPRAFRQAWPFMLTSFLLFTIPALVAGFITLNDPESALWLLPADIQRLVPQIEQQELWTNIPLEERPYFSSAITTNNVQVSFLAFAGGALAGLMTIYVMILNGLLIGGLTGLTGHYGIGFDLWTFAIGHGVIELTTIFIAGASGLQVGWSIINPGLLRRRDALILAARKALKLIVGCVPILIIAGLIEGFISPNESIPWPVKWGVGITTGLLLYAYLLLSGRTAEPEEIDAPST